MALLDIKGRRGPWSWKNSMQQYKGIPGQGSRRGLIVVQKEGRWLMGFSGRRRPEKGKSFEM